jgi:hypothetical protein
MTFQTSIDTDQGYGTFGNLYSDAPHVVETFILRSPNPANNVYGRFFTTSSTEGIARAGGSRIGNIGSAGFLINPHHNASYGTQSQGPLSSTLTLPNEIEAEFLTRGFIYANVQSGDTGVPRIGDYIFYSVNDGSLYASNQFPLDPPSQTEFANARIDQFDPNSPGLCVIEVILVPLQDLII